MTCTCPKCRETIELDLPEVSEAGNPVSCPSCNARFVVYRESFGARALHKTGSVSCAPCGAQLGPETHCAICGAQFPDLLVAGLGRQRARRKAEKVKLSISPLPAKRSTAAIPSLDISLKAGAGQVGGSPKPGPGSNLLKGIVAIVVLLALAGGGGAYYVKSNSQKTYIKAFVLASYCIQTGIDHSRKATNKRIAEWKQKTDAGQPYVPHSAPDDERDFGIISGKLEPALAKVNQPPEKFAYCNDKLFKLQGVYNKMRNLALTPGNSLSALVDNSNKLDAEYEKAAKEYRAGLPDKIVEALRDTGQKFRALKPLVP